jgi:quercetin 2,3-dioxygenase
VTTIRKAADRGRTRTDWLDSAHSFSFGGYYDPAFLGFRRLRVLNDDRVAPGSGFPPHSHAEMEILTFVLEGALSHRDNAGNEGVIRAGEVQRMSAGRGIAHSEMNASREEPVHFLQVWIEPGRAGLAPSYEQRAFPGREAGWVRLVDPDGRDGAVRVDQDVVVWRARLAAGERPALPVDAGRHAWLQLLSGDLEIDGHRLGPGDGAALSPGELPNLETREPSELLVFDLA